MQLFMETGKTFQIKFLTESKRIQKILDLKKTGNGQKMRSESVCAWLRSNLTSTLKILRNFYFGEKILVVGEILKLF
jgi:hypothetical protein